MHGWQPFLFVIGMLIGITDGQQATLYVSSEALDSYMVILKQEYTSNTLLKVAARTVKQAAEENSEVTIERLFENLFLGFSAKMDDQTLDMVRQYAEVEYVEQDISVVEYSTPRHLDRIDQRSSTLDGASYNPIGDARGVGVYVVDTGIMEDHEEFSGRLEFVPDESEKCDFLQGQSAETPQEDLCGWHGTGMAALVGGNTYGVAKNVSLYDVRVLVGRCHSGDHLLSEAIHGLDMVVHHGALPAVVLLAFGTDGAHESVTLTAATQIMHNLGFTLVAAAGYQDGCDSLLGQAQHVIRVSQVSSALPAAPGDLYIYGSMGPCVDLFAPGFDVETADITSTTAHGPRSGTSVSAAIVAGIAAVIIADDPSQSPSDVKTRLLAGATSGTIALLTGPGPVTPNKLAYVGPGL
ncbi:aqualysin-1-like [Ptychodera flava]|uniref:aqualysin-1-like n=1 Tax=Ptychodera flava TaxID=63121 RepID=UPI00396AA8C1